MDFSWSEKSLVIQQTVHQFAQDKLLAEYQNNDNKHAFDKIMPKPMGQFELIATELTKTYAWLNLAYLVARQMVEDIKLMGFKLACEQLLARANSNAIARLSSPHVGSHCIPKVILGENLAVMLRHIPFNES